MRDTVTFFIVLILIVTGAVAMTYNLFGFAL